MTNYESVKQHLTVGSISTSSRHSSKASWSYCNMMSWNCCWRYIYLSNRRYFNSQALTCYNNSLTTTCDLDTLKRLVVGHSHLTCCCWLKATSRPAGLIYWHVWYHTSTHAHLNDRHFIVRQLYKDSYWLFRCVLTTLIYSLHIVLYTVNYILIVKLRSDNFY